MDVFVLVFFIKQMFWIKLYIIILIISVYMVGIEKKEYGLVQLEGEAMHHPGKSLDNQIKSLTK